MKLTRPSSYELLQDSLSCLASDEIKLASLKSKQDDDAAGMEPVGGGGGLGLAGPNEAALTEAVKAAAQKAIISKVQKTNIIENIVPIVIALKRKLDEAKSPLIDDLMTYLRELMKDYKNEVKEILSADKQLATEIQYDLKKWEEEMEARRQRIIEEQVKTFCNFLESFHDVNFLYITTCQRRESRELPQVCSLRFACIFDLVKSSVALHK